MCLRSRCVAVRWIQPSDLYVTIEDCSSPSAEPPVPATVHWRQRAALISRTQSSYNPQLCSACAPRTVVRRSLGDHLSTRARTRGTCSPGPPGEDQAIFSEIGDITLIARRSRFPPSPAPPYPVLACDTLRPDAPRLSPTLAGGPIRRATPCMIIAGGSGARATADSASPHALWPAAARCRAPCLRRMEARLQALSTSNPYDPCALRMGGYRSYETGAIDLV